MYDVKITSGTIVDGTGARRFPADIASRTAWIVEVSAEASLDGDAAETHRRHRALVTPGFVDVHTHYDGQATLGRAARAVVGHGVTTVVDGQLRRRVRAGAARATSSGSSS